MDRKYLGIKYLLFDLDHTLWDTEKNSVVALRELYLRFSLSKYFSSFDVFNETYQRENDELWARLTIDNLTVPEIWVGRFRNTLATVGVVDEAFTKELSHEYMLLMTSSKELMPNAKETLEALKDKYVLCVATNGLPIGQRSKIKSSGLDVYFAQERIFVSEELDAAKPEREYFDKIMDALGSQARECVMIGDNPNTDILGAKNYGIATIWYNSRNSDVEIESDKIDNLAELREKLL